MVIRAAQWTQITHEETTAKSIPIVSRLPNDHGLVAEAQAENILV
jgi:hypothetical protein